MHAAKLMQPPPDLYKPADNYAFRLIERHFAPLAPQKLLTTSRYFPDRLKAELIAPLAELTAEVGSDGFTGLHFRGDSRGGFSSLLVEDDDPVLVAASHFEEVDLGLADSPDGRLRCLKNGLWLGGEGDARFAAVYTYDTDTHGDSALRLEVAVLPGEAGARETRRIFARFDDALKQARMYRGRVLSFERSELFGYAGIKVHALAKVTREQIILAASTLELIERNILRFTAQRPALAALGLPVKKGVLLYGPPGTGKTLTIQYIAAELKEATTFLMTAEEVANLPEYISLARRIQPAVIVIEDIDLIAADRDDGYSFGGHSLLNRLLNEMDGLREDAEILFILTTNRPEVLEPALAARPGRIDQAIEFPLPDEACRRRLVRWYSGRLPVADATVEEVTRRTKGVTASFIKELMRRAAQFHLDEGGEGEVPVALFVRSLEEMTVMGGKLTAKLLGAGTMGFGGGG